MIYIKDDNGYSWYFNGKNMVVINDEGEDDSYECSSLEEGIKLLNEDGHITSVEKDPSWLFVFADNWDHTEDTYYHPEIIVANSIYAALDIFASNVYGFVDGKFVNEDLSNRKIKVYQYTMDIPGFGRRIEETRIYMYPIKSNTFLGSSYNYKEK